MKTKKYSIPQSIFYKSNFKLGKIILDFSWIFHIGKYFSFNSNDILNSRCKIYIQFCTQIKMYGCLQDRMV